MAAWYIFFALVLSSVGFPFSLPVGDLSNFLEKKKSNISEESSNA
jgi:hypothetical protein